MVISQGDIWWADFPDPEGSGPGFRRPVVLVQGDAFNQSRIATVVCVPLTSNLKWAAAPGNVLLSARITLLPKDSVANVSQLITLDRKILSERISKLPRSKLDLLSLASLRPGDVWKAFLIKHGNEQLFYDRPRFGAAA